MTNPTAGMIVIGDEILSGRTRDANMYHLAGRLTAIGIDLAEVRIVADDRDQIIGAVNALRHAHDMVFTSGGIGPTHDDITADCIAAAFGVGIDVREDAKAVLATNYPNGAADLTEARLRMARIPDGADLIENQVSKAPGFSMQNVHVMAGVPRVFTCMVDWLLPRLAQGTPVQSVTINANLPESKIAGPLGKIATEFPDLTFGSYPYYEDGGHGANLVIRGADSTQIARAEAAIRTRVLNG
ncbi:molybdenum cofactor biosynthesis protein [Amylibacter marinus]|uniref:Molybdenum cofactor biosynthesis protein n=1 Tax=Amylibacter marinus TaxID=1475483 RepID=A0ABQ5VW25_9RHOB|nr:molybdopterin-binding protein [Amylibacter marinus]GLQ35550.1 molybdenum cofactor biosynthesis protein [Amylibacter marinus]